MGEEQCTLLVLCEPRMILSERDRHRHDERRHVSSCPSLPPWLPMASISSRPCVTLLHWTSETLQPLEAYATTCSVAGV